MSTLEATCTSSVKRLKKMILTSENPIFKELNELSGNVLMQLVPIHRLVSETDVLGVNQWRGVYSSVNTEKKFELTVTRLSREKYEFKLYRKRNRKKKN